MDFNVNDDSFQQPFLGELSGNFTSPVLPKIIVVGMSSGWSAEVDGLKEILEKACTNLFVLEFVEQFIPFAKESYPKSYRQPRTHLVKEEWITNLRHYRPAILIDFRFLRHDEVADNSLTVSHDARLSEQIGLTKDSVPSSGPVYVSWLGGEGRLSAPRASSITKNSKLEKGSLVVFDLTSGAQKLAADLKPAIQHCFELSRSFYSTMSLKYKGLINAEPTKYAKPWMLSSYYYFKLAVVEEFRNDFNSALKYYHSVLAKYKQIIEDASLGLDARMETINFLRTSADICFIRLSFLLFRLGQASEAEFGLFRYLNFFGNGLNQAEQLIWRYNIVRTFSRQLSNSFIWNPERSGVLRGPTHFLIFAVTNAKQYLKMTDSAEIYRLQELIITDLAWAIQSCPLNSDHLMDYLQLQVLVQYAQLDDYTNAQLYIDYLKSRQDFQKWLGLKGQLLDFSLISSKTAQKYSDWVSDKWMAWCIEGDVGDFEEFDRFCILNHQISSDIIRLNFSQTLNNILLLSVRFEVRKQAVNSPVNINVAIFNASRQPFVIESLGVFFDTSNEGLSVFIPEDCVIAPSSITQFNAEFVPLKVGMAGVSFVTMQLKTPLLILQYDQGSILNSENMPKLKRDLASTSEGLRFERILSQARRKDLQLEVLPLKPVLDVDFELESAIIAGIMTQIPVKLRNVTDYPIIGDIYVSSNQFCTLYDTKGEILEQPIKIPMLQKDDIQIVGIQCKLSQLTKLEFKVNYQFDINSMDFRVADICSFEPHQMTKAIVLKPLSPFFVEVEPIIKATDRSQSFRFSYLLNIAFRANDVAFEFLTKPILFEADSNCIESFQSSGSQARPSESLKFAFDVGFKYSFNLIASFRLMNSKSNDIIDYRWPIVLPERPDSINVFTEVPLEVMVDEEFLMVWEVCNYSKDPLRAIGLIQSFPDGLELLTASNQPAVLNIPVNSLQRIERSFACRQVKAFDLSGIFRLVGPNGKIIDYNSNSIASLTAREMQPSSKLKAMKFMNRKEEAQTRLEQETTQQKSAERTHWSLSEKERNSATSSTASNVSGPKFQVEYDLNSSTCSVAGRQSFKNFKKDVDNAVAKASPPKQAKTDKDVEMSNKL